MATSALAAGGVGMALRKLQFKTSPRQVPLVGLSAAFIFAAQLLNFPVAGGTSGHLIGGVLAAVLVGPWASTVALTSVLVLQCFLFGDGGVTCLGANVFNLAVLAPMVGYSVYKPLRGISKGTRGTLFAAAFAGWVSTVAASIVCAGELAASGTVGWKIVFPAMAGVHGVIGLGEAAMTSLVLASVTISRPELLDSDQRSTDFRSFASQGVLVALGLVIFIAPFTCGWPDGLDTVASRLGFDSRATTPPLVGCLQPGHAAPGFHRMAVSSAVAGSIGTLLAFALSMALARSLASKK